MAASSMVPHLPVLKGGQSDYPEWRSYVRWVYGEDVAEGSSLDLNGFSWFYTQAPFDPPLSPVDHPAWAPISEGTAWTCSALLFPECEFAGYGFFVKRPPPEPTVPAWTSTGRIEVLRVKYPEFGAAWFYHGVGSGVFLNLDALPASGSVLVSAGRPTDWSDPLDTSVASYMLERNCALLIITQRFADARSELVVRAPDASANLDVVCPFFAASVFSTGLSHRLACTCSSETVGMLNCRPQVWATMAGEAAQGWWLRFALDALLLLRLLALVALGLTAAWLQRAAR